MCCKYRCTYKYIREYKKYVHVYTIYVYKGVWEVYICMCIKHVQMFAYVYYGVWEVCICIYNICIQGSMKGMYMYIKYMYIREYGKYIYVYEYNTYRCTHMYIREYEKYVYVYTIYVYKGVWEV